MMKCPLDKPCARRKRLEEAEDKIHYLEENCPLYEMEDSYPYLAKDVLRCSVCLMEGVMGAFVHKEITLSSAQAVNLGRKLNTAIYHYIIYNCEHLPRKSK